MQDIQGFLLWFTLYLKQRGFFTSYITKIEIYGKRTTYVQDMMIYIQIFLRATKSVIKSEQAEVSKFFASIIKK